MGISIKDPIDPDLKQNILHFACYAGHLHLVQYFLSLEECPDINSRDSMDWTRMFLFFLPYFFARANLIREALLCAASICHVDLCNLLLQHGADPKGTIYVAFFSCSLLTLISVAVNRQQTSVLHYLCRKTQVEESPKNPKKGRDKASKISSSKYDDSMIYSSPYLTLLQTLLEKGVEINQQNDRGETPLMQAAQKGNEEAVHFLLGYKADYRLTNK